jgi:hypothetical protein
MVRQGAPDKVVDQLLGLAVGLRHRWLSGLIVTSRAAR